MGDALVKLYFDKAIATRRRAAASHELFEYYQSMRKAPTLLNMREDPQLDKGIEMVIGPAVIYWQVQVDVMDAEFKLGSYRKLVRKGLGKELKQRR